MVYQICITVCYSYLVAPVSILQQHNRLQTVIPHETPEVVDGVRKWDLGEDVRLLLSETLSVYYTIVLPQHLHVINKMVAAVSSNEVWKTPSAHNLKYLIIYLHSATLALALMALHRLRIYEVLYLICIRKLLLTVFCNVRILEPCCSIVECSNPSIVGMCI